MKVHDLFSEKTLPDGKGTAVDNKWEYRAEDDQDESDLGYDSEQTPQLTSLLRKPNDVLTSIR